MVLLFGGVVPSAVLMLSTVSPVMKTLWVLAAGLLLALTAFLLVRTEPASNSGAHPEEPASREPPAWAADLARSVRVLPYRYASRGREAAGRALRARVIDLSGMPRGVRVLAVLGYASVATSLVAVLLIELFGGGMPSVRYYKYTDAHVLVPIPAMVVSSLACVLGWALLLTGASDCRRRVFLPTVGLFLLQLFLLLSSAAATGSGILVMWGLALPLVALPVGIHFFTPRLSHWRDFPVLEFCIWAAVASVFVACTWFLSETRADVAPALEAGFLPLFLLLIPFWILLALEVVDVTADLSRLAVSGLRRSLSERVLSVLAMPTLLAWPLLPVVLWVLTGDPLWSLGLLPSTLLVIAATVLLVSRRWTIRAAATLLALEFALFVTTPGILMAFGGNDLLSLTLSATGLIPPAVLFSGLVAYDVFNFGVRFASTDGHVMPRTGRTLMYFGVAMLVMSYALLDLNMKCEGASCSGDLSSFVTDLFAVSILYLGPPYLAWLTWKRRERLIGEAFDSPAGVKRAQQARAPRGRNVG